MTKIYDLTPDSADGIHFRYLKDEQTAVRLSITQQTTLSMRLYTAFVNLKIKLMVEIRESS